MNGYIRDLRTAAVYYARNNTSVFANTLWQQFTQSLGRKICERATREVNVVNAARIASNAGNDQNA